MLDTANIMKRIVFLILLNPSAAPDDPLGAIIQTFFQQQGRLATTTLESWRDVVTVCQELSRQIIAQEGSPLNLPNLSAEDISKDPRVLADSKKLLTPEKLKEYYRYLVAIDPHAPQSDNQGAMITSTYGEMSFAGCTGYHNWADIVPKLEEHTERLIALHQGPLTLPPVPQVKSSAPKPASSSSKPAPASIPAPKKPKHEPPFTLEQKGKRRKLTMVDDFDLQAKLFKTNRDLEFKTLEPAIEAARILAAQDGVTITIRDKKNLSALEVPPNFTGLSDDASDNPDDSDQPLAQVMDAEETDTAIDEEYDAEETGDSEAGDDETFADDTADEEFTDETDFTEDLGEVEAEEADEANEAPEDIQMAGTAIPYSLWMEALKIELNNKHPLAIIKAAPNKEYEFEDLAEAITFAKPLANHVAGIITIRDAAGEWVEDVQPQN